MSSFVRFARAASVCAALGLAVVSVHGDARACGGCFHPKTEITGGVITDHRMVFKISTQETILWDQVRYSGDPEEFAWVLPVREGARVELSRDEWLAALDASTKTTVKGPERSCGSGFSGGRGGGCALGPSAAATSASYSDYGGGGDDGDLQGNAKVQVLSQEVIGPYQAVTIRATGTTGISEWLADNGFAIPAEVVPVIDAYTSERFDFIALRLRPGTGVRAMRPVRVVTPGADTTLPLRMVAAGIGSHVGLTLWVIGEGRYHTQNFPDAVVDESRLTWDGRAARSNLTTLQAEALAENGGRGWLTEAAMPADTVGSFQRSVSSFMTGVNPSLHDAYYQTCLARPPRTVKCDTTALPPPDGKPEDLDIEQDAGADAGDLDAGAPDSGSSSGSSSGSDSDAGAASDAGAGDDAGSGGGSGGGQSGSTASCTKVVSGCDGYDDLDVATRGLHEGDIWVTRLRADLPASALGTDLRLEAAPSQEPVSPAHSTDTFSDPDFDPCANSPNASPRDSSDPGCACRTTGSFDGGAGSWLALGLAGVGLALSARRRRRR